MKGLSRLLIFSGIIFFSSGSGYCSVNPVDSLHQVLRGEMQDSTRMITLIELAWVSRGFGQPDIAIEAAKDALRLGRSYVENSNDPVMIKAGGNCIGASYNILAVLHADRGDLDKAILYFSHCASIGKRLGNHHSTSISYANIASTLVHKGEYKEALSNYMNSLLIAEEINDPYALSLCYTGIANIHYSLQDFESSVSYYLKSLEINRELNDERNIALSFYSLGNCFYCMADSSMSSGNCSHAEILGRKARENYLQSLLIRERNSDNRAAAESLGSLGHLYLLRSRCASGGEKNKLLDSSMYYHKRCYEICKETGNIHTISVSMTGMGQIYCERKQYNEALKLFEEALEIAVISNDRKEKYQIYNEISKAYEGMGNGLMAHEYFKKFIALRDSIVTEENRKESLRLEYKFEYEKQAAADSIRAAEAKKITDAQITAQQAQLDSEKTQKYALYGGLSLLFLFGGITYNRFRVTRSQKNIIQRQKQDVDSAFHQLEEKNKEILDSISYAKRIQSAILPPQKLVKKYLEDSFILYKPKDIVAGDFYWIEVVKDKIFFTAADCTGHGVPGAMVSVVCSHALTKAVKEMNIYEPAGILDKTVELLEERFSKSEEEVKDGMDLALCCLDNELSTLQYAGANNPLYQIRDNQLIEIKADKQPVGKYSDRKPYTNHVINILPGDCFYIFSDGYADQFGGKKGKKYKAANFKNLLLEIHKLPMDVQKEMISQAFEEWRGSLEQVDDICVIGVRI